MERKITDELAIAQKLSSDLGQEMAASWCDSGQQKQQQKQLKE